MRKVLVPLAAAVLVLAFALTLMGQEKKEMEKPAKMPKPEGEAFWTYVSETHPYAEWMVWPGHEELQEGQSPHGDYIRIYANDIAMKAAKKGKDMPYGAIVMKENYNKDKELVALTPMYKVKGFNPEGGDWFWAKYGPEGEDMASGKVKGCVDCHAKVKKKDWRFVHYEGEVGHDHEKMKEHEKEKKEYEKKSE